MSDELKVLRARIANQANCITELQEEIYNLKVENQAVERLKTAVDVLTRERDELANKEWQLMLRVREEKATLIFEGKYRYVPEYRLTEARIKAMEECAAIADGTPTADHNCAYEMGCNDVAKSIRWTIQQLSQASDGRVTEE